MIVKGIEEKELFERLEQFRVLKATFSNYVHTSSYSQ